jgi:hypothetical protein
LKDLRILFIALIILCFNSPTHAQKDRTLSNGFSISWEFGFPSAKYGYPIDLPTDMRYKLNMGIKLGNRWYINPTEKYGIGIMVNWVDLTATQRKIKDPDFTHATAEFSFLQIGPIGTYALTPEIAFDVYYNLRPSSVATLIDNGSGSDDYQTNQGIGITHGIGVNFRWRALCIGLESIFGSVTDSNGGIEYLEDEKMYVNRTRLLVGVKF